MNWKQVFSLGLLAPGEWGGRGEPVAYLYNGVRLPKLPEWDKTVYPYAVIDKMLWAYRLHLFEHRPYALSGTSITYGPMDGSTYIYKGAIREGVGSEWDFDSVSTDTDGIVASAVQWANFDMLYDDGSICMAASDPIPVYK